MVFCFCAIVPFFLFWKDLKMFCFFKKSHGNKNLKVWMRQVDACFPRSIADLVFQYLDTPPFELHVTREIILRCPLLNFNHISVFNVRVHEKCVIFHVIADIRHGCVFFELHLNNTYAMHLSGVFGTFPDSIKTHQERSAWLQRFLKATAGKRGIFHGSQSSNTFSVVACDRIEDGVSSFFCPNFNMFHITDKRSFGAKMRRIDPSRFY